MANMPIFNALDLNQDLNVSSLSTPELQQAITELRSALTKNLGHQSQLLFELLQQEDEVAANGARTMNRLEKEAGALGASIRRLKQELEKRPKPPQPTSAEEIAQMKLYIQENRAKQQMVRDTKAAYLRELRRRGYSAKTLRKARKAHYKRGLPIGVLRKLQKLERELFRYGWTAWDQSNHLGRCLQNNRALGLEPAQEEIVGELGEA